MHTTEIWKPCEEAPGVLEVSNYGAVRTVDRLSRVYGRTRGGRVQGEHTQRKRGKELSPYVTRSGYAEVAVMVDGKRTKYRVHRLVGRAFVPGHFEGASIDHRDGNKLNNNAANLEWVTLSENTRRQWEAGLVDLRGENHASAKISNLQAHAIAILYDHNFPPSQLAEWFGVSSALVYKIAKGRRDTGKLRSRYPSKAT